MMRDRTFAQSFAGHRLGMIGLAGVLVIVILGVFAPLIAPVSEIGPLTR